MKEASSPSYFLQRQLHSENDTENFARELAQYLRSGDCITFTGALGAGKTAFVRSVIRELSPQARQREVVSPTFLLVQEYDVVAAGSSCRLWHFDLYRLESTGELAELGLEEALESGIVCIEWAQMADSLLPDDRLAITIDYGDKEDERIISLSGNDEWLRRLGHLRDYVTAGET